MKPAAVLAALAGCGGSAGGAGPPDAGDRDGPPPVVAGDDGGIGPRPARCRPPDDPGAIRFEPVALAGEPLSTQDCVVLHDLDGDGAEDVVTATDLGVAALVVLWGRPDGRFAPERLSHRLPRAPRGGGCLVADLTGDGRRDVLLAGSDPPTLLVQDQPRRFRDASDALPTIAPQGARGLAAADVDGDAWPDVYLGRVNTVPPFGKFAIDCVPTLGDFRCHFEDEFSSPPDRLLRNEEGRRFSDASARFGIANPGYTLAVAVADFDGDGGPDFVVGNDYAPNNLYLSEDGTYADRWRDWGLTDYNHAMGVVVGDFDGDLRWDLYVTDAGPDQIYFGAEGGFVERGLERGVVGYTREHFGWGVIAEDFDNDGDQDLLVANSLIARPGELRFVAEAGGDPDADRHMAEAQGDYLMDNCGDGTFAFSLVPHAEDFVPMIQFSPLAAGDFDGDGGVDVLEGYSPRGVRLLRNVTAARGHYLRVRLRGRAPNTDALGARVQVAAGGATWLRQVQAAAAGGHGTTTVHVGLGAAAAADVTVWWPSGRVSERRGVAADAVLELDEE